MSVHLFVAAAYLEGIPASRKLVLMAIADSADEHTRHSAPGLPKLRAWANLSKSAALAAVKQLTEDGLIARVEAGRLGRRATYLVFPTGSPGIPDPAAVAARFDPSLQAVDSLDEGCGKPDETGSCQQDPRVLNEASRVLPTGPLQSSTSVSTRDAIQKPARPVDYGTGFPGSRATAAEDRGVRSRARGAHNMACPMHPEEVVPCGRCANIALKDRERDPDAPSRFAAMAREGIRSALALPADTPDPPLDDTPPA